MTHTVIDDDTNRHYRHTKSHYIGADDIYRHQTRHYFENYAFRQTAGTPCYCLLFYLLLQAITAISYASIVTKYVVFLKVLQPHMGVIFCPLILV